MFGGERINALLGGDLVWIATFIIILACLGVTVALRPRTAPWWAVIFLPLVGIAAIAMPVWGLFEPTAAAAMVASGLEAAGGVLVIVSAVRWAEERPFRRVHSPAVDLPDAVRRLDPDNRQLHHSVPIAELQVGDRVRMEEGEIIPADGVVIEGDGLINSKPALGVHGQLQVSAGDEVFAGSVCESGGLIMELKTTPKDSFSQRRVRITRAVSKKLLRPGGYALVFGLIAIALTLAAAYAVVLIQEGGSLLTWLPVWVGLGLAAGTIGPGLSQVRLRSLALALATKLGLIFSRARDLITLATARAWQVEPRLLTAPGEVEVVPLGEDVSEELLLIVAEALSAEGEQLEQASFAAALARDGVERQRVSDQLVEGDLIWGTVNARRWFLCPLSELNRFAKDVTAVRAVVDRLKKEGKLAYVLGREDTGALGAVGIQMTADPEVAKAASSLDARLQAGLPDEARKALAAAAHVGVKPPRIGWGAASMCRVDQATQPAGRNLFVLSADTSASMPDEGEPRVMKGSLVAFADGYPELQERVHRGLKRSVVLVLLPTAIALPLAWLGFLTPAVGAALGFLGVWGATLGTRERQI